MSSTTTPYAPPPYPPPVRPLLTTSAKPRYNIDLEELSAKGWVRLNIAQSPEDPIYKTYSELFDSSSAFFDLDEATKEKYFIPVHMRSQQSEEGYSNIPGEKCMITLRRVSTTPSEFELRERAAAAWRASGQLMLDVLEAIEESLGMQKGVLTRLMGPMLDFPGENEESVATLLRMFRYERPTGSSEPGVHVQPPPRSRVVADPHRDLGLLSLVVGHTPGLECLDPSSNTWVSCEEGNTLGQLTASLLVGQTLAKFANWRFIAGRHRVFVHPLSVPPPDSRSPLKSPAYRFSLVYALRAHLPIVVSSSDFTTHVTGDVAENIAFSNTSIAQIYDAISRSHWNINIAQDERRQQERNVKDTGSIETDQIQPLAHRP